MVRYSSPGGQPGGAPPGGGIHCSGCWAAGWGPKTVFELLKYLPANFLFAKYEMLAHAIE